MKNLLCRWRIVLVLLLAQGTVQAQSFTWTPLTTNLPASIQVFQGTATGPIAAFYARVGYSDTTLVAKALVSVDADGKAPLSAIISQAGAYVGVNGGYFNTTSNPAVSYSLVVNDGVLIARQIASVTRTSGFYTVMRAAFAVKEDRSFGTSWVYHFGNDIASMYAYDAPMPNTLTTPAPPPLTADGAPWRGIVEAIGGGPNLVSNGSVNVTYDEEVFFESGVESALAQPRSAIGYTASGDLIMLVVDGRQASSVGVTLPQLANIMIGLGCVEAMNLDGGGSSTLVADGTVINSPSDGSERHIPTAFAVLPAPTPPAFEKDYDTEGAAYQEYGSGWITTANPGSFGAGARLNPVGTGEDRAVFRLGLPAAGSYDVYAWWVAASNRAANTPFIVHHSGGTDTVRMNQSTGGSSWQKVGEFSFTGTDADSVEITDQADAGATTTYVAADGLRIVAKELTTAVRSSSSDVPSSFGLSEAYPNPFNPSTRLEITLPEQAWVDLTVFDQLGREVERLASREMHPGTHHVIWDASGVASGLYVVRMAVRNNSGPLTPISRKALLLR